MLDRLFRKREAAADPCVPEGQRLYAIGDIHGRLDLLDALLRQIDADDAARAPADTQLIFLGDLVDRGPDSAAVVERLRRLAIERPNTLFLMGNHEEVLLAALDGDARAMHGFCRIGGRETALSYGIDPALYERMDYEELHAALTRAVPASHVSFLRSFEDWAMAGDYMFVHAGVAPKVALDAQKPGDLRWIRRGFLEHRRRLDRMIVHGHTIHPEVERRPHRIGIDTGAYETGRLTALGLEEAAQWVLQT